jgi:hypothetical protein
MSDEKAEKAERAIEAAAKAAWRAHYGLEDGVVGWETATAVFREDWTRSVHAALRELAASGTVLGVRPMAPAPCPPGWTTVSRSHWQNGDEAAMYQPREVLRDCLANSALNGLLSYNAELANPERRESTARRAYEMADAMLAARERKP